MSSCSSVLRQWNLLLKIDICSKIARQHRFWCYALEYNVLFTKDGTLIGLKTAKEKKLIRR